MCEIKSIFVKSICNIVARAIHLVNYVWNFFFSNYIYYSLISFKPYSVQS